MCRRTPTHNPSVSLWTIAVQRLECRTGATGHFVKVAYDTANLIEVKSDKMRHKQLAADLANRFSEVSFLPYLCFGSFQVIVKFS
jgi:hypothetical protein